MSETLIMVAPNGARRKKTDHPAIPIAVKETVRTARECFEAGAQALHLHVRDGNGDHSLDVGLYREAIQEIGVAVPRLRVQITTEAVGQYDVPGQLNCLQHLAPDWASISVREIARKPELASQVYEACAGQRTEVQHIIYDLADLRLYQRWLEDRIIQPHQQSVLLVLGRYTANQHSEPADLDPLLMALGRETPWMACAFGPQEHACLATAAALGGDVRVGFENSLVNESGLPHEDNAASVRALRRQLE